MASHDSEASRTSDDVRDPKSLREAKHNFDEAKLDVHHTGRVIPRAIQGDFSKGLHKHGPRTEFGVRNEYSHKQQNHQGSKFAERSNTKPEVKLPTFDGSSLKLDFLDWIDTIEDYFEAMDPPEAIKCKVAASKLKGGARTWWKEMQNIRLSEGKNLITSWKRMRNLLLKRFLPTSRLTYFHNQPSRQENEDDVKHANCSTNVPFEPNIDKHDGKQIHSSDFEHIRLTRSIYDEVNAESHGITQMPSLEKTEATSAGNILIQISEKKNTGDKGKEESGDGKRVESTFGEKTNFGLVEELGKDTQNVPLPKSIGHHVNEVPKDKKDSCNVQDCDVQETPDFEAVNLKWECTAVYKDSRQPPIGATMPPSLSQRWSRGSNCDVEVKRQTWDLKKDGAESIIQLQSNPSIPKAGWSETSITLQGPVLFNCRGQRHQVKKPKSVNRFEKVTKPLADGHMNLACSNFGESVGSNYSKFVSLLFDPGGSIYLSDNFGFAVYLLSCSSTLPGSKMDTMYFSFYEEINKARPSVHKHYGAYGEMGADVKQAAKAMVETKEYIKKTNEFADETSAMWKSIVLYTKGDHLGLSNHEFVGVIQENIQREDKLKIWHNRKAGLGYLGSDLVALAGGALEQVAKQNLAMALSGNDRLINFLTSKVQMFTYDPGGYRSIEHIVISNEDLKQLGPRSNVVLTTFLATISVALDHVIKGLTCEILQWYICRRKAWLPTTTGMISLWGLYDFSAKEKHPDMSHMTALFYSSSTTRTGKGMVYSHRNFISDAFLVGLYFVRFFTRKNTPSYFTFVVFGDFIITWFVMHKCWNMSNWMARMFSNWFRKEMVRSMVFSIVVPSLALQLPIFELLTEYLKCFMLIFMEEGNEKQKSNSLLSQLPTVKYFYECFEGENDDSCPYIIYFKPFCLVSISIFQIRLCFVGSHFTSVHKVASVASSYLLGTLGKKGGFKDNHPDAILVLNKMEGFTCNIMAEVDEVLHEDGTTKRSDIDGKLVFGMGPWCNLQINTVLNLTRGRLIQWEGWNDENNSNTEERFIVAKLMGVTVFSCTSIICKNGQVRETSKMFCKLVNGLDPPMDVNDMFVKPRFIQVRTWASFRKKGRWNDAFYITRSNLSPEAVINLDHGDPTVFESYWQNVGDKATFTMAGDQSLSYFADSKKLCWFLEPKLEEGIRRLHEVVGNAEASGHHVIVGNGSSQLLQATLYALCPPDQPNPVSILSAAPFYSAYPEMIGFLQSRLYKWEGDAREYEKKGPYIELVTSPNNPTGVMQEPVVGMMNGDGEGRIIHDLAYYWPHYTPIAHKLDYDIMLFTVSKCTGHAGSRIGWALVRDEGVARKMTKFMEISTIGVSKESQLRAAQIVGIISDSCEHTTRNCFDNFFQHSKEIMTQRWEALTKVVERNRLFTLPKYPLQYCHFTRDRTSGGSRKLLWGGLSFFRGIYISTKKKKLL